MYRSHLQQWDGASNRAAQCTEYIQYSQIGKHSYENTSILTLWSVLSTIKYSELFLMEVNAYKNKTIKDGDIAPWKDLEKN